MRYESFQNGVTRDKKHSITKITLIQTQTLKFVSNNSHEFFFFKNEKHSI